MSDASVNRLARPALVRRGGETDERDPAAHMFLDAGGGDDRKSPRRAQISIAVFPRRVGRSQPRRMSVEDSQPPPTLPDVGDDVDDDDRRSELPAARARSSG